ncbi:MAG: hypothetical protein U0Q03_24710 [Acidimicrobiales bacterium]
MKHLMRGVVIAGVLIGVSACGSDDDSTASKATAAETETDATEASGGGGSGTNPDVEAYCSSAEDLADEFQKLMADPASGDVAAVTAAATELTQKAAALVSAHAEDTARINECTEKLTTAMAGG